MAFAGMLLEKTVGWPEEPERDSPEPTFVGEPQDWLDDMGILMAFHFGGYKNHHNGLYMIK